MKNEQHYIGVNIDKKLWRKLKAVGKDQDRSIASLVRKLIEDHVGKSYAKTKIAAQ